MLIAWLVAATAAGCAKDQDPIADQTDELPPPEQVFRYAASADAGQVYLDFDIAEFPTLGKRMVRSGQQVDIYDAADSQPFGPL